MGAPGKTGREERMKGKSSPILSERAGRDPILFHLCIRCVFSI
jgi:hypothetical protein